MFILYKKTQLCSLDRTDLSRYEQYLYYDTVKQYKTVYINRKSYNIIIEKIRKIILY